MLRLDRHILSVLLLFNVAATSGAATIDSVITQTAESAGKVVDYLKQHPDLGISRCMLSPDFSEDRRTVSISRDHVFTAGDVFLEIAGVSLDLNSNSPIRDVLMKHLPTETIDVKIKRGSEERMVSAKCTDAKLYNDLLLEGLYAASKRDMVTCASKLGAASDQHILDYFSEYISYRCRGLSNQISGLALQQALYDVDRHKILFSKTSPDALSHIRGGILSDLVTLQQNSASVLADDLKKILDDAVAASAAK